MAIADSSEGKPVPKKFSLTTVLWKMLILAFDALGVWFIVQAISLGYVELAIIVGIIVVGFNIIFTLDKGYPFRWMALGLAFLVMFNIYPIFFTMYISFTNYGDGHLLTKKQALAQIQKVTYLPEDAKTYSWTAYRSPEGNYALWLVDNSDGQTYLAKPGEEIIPAKPGDPGIGEADTKGIPVLLEGYTRLTTLQAVANKELSNIKFGIEGEKTVQVRTSNEAAELELRFVYDEATDTIIDQSNGDVYFNKEGTFTTKDGKTISPGFRATVGWKNFQEVFNSPALRGPLITMLIWNFIFPTLSVLTTFALGLAISIMYNEEGFPLKKPIRTLLLIPYTIPSVISILIWRGMFNTEFGVINRMLIDIIGVAPRWTSEPFWARTAVIIVNLWLGFPYMMLITSGALQSIPSEIYEAAEVDGASGWQRFWKITLPLLLVSVGPLLIASYIFNFNNFNLIYLLLGGGPPIPGAATQAGYTDILISYIYNLAFAPGGRGVRYGLASAMSMMLFIIVGAITLFQYRFTNMWEEVSENV